VIFGKELLRDNSEDPPHYILPFNNNENDNFRFGGEEVTSGKRRT